MLQHQLEKVESSLVLAQFEEIAARYPDATAVECQDSQLSYRGLKERSDRIAANLRLRGAGPGTLIALCLNRSVDLVAATLGILRAGAAYLPVDPFLPEQRIDFMLRDAAAELVICEPELSSKLSGRAFFTAAELSKPAGPDSFSNLRDPEPDDLAYVIFTSGSTGKPKGVEITHRGLQLCLDVVRGQIEAGPDDTLLAFTSQSFDVSVMETLVALTSGVRLVLMPQSRVMQADALIAAINRYKPTILFGTPPLWRLLIEMGWKGSRDLRAITGGESLDGSLAARLIERSRLVWNHYGPTEVSIVATSCRVSADRLPPPIGYALPHIRAFVADANDGAAALGEAGELLIAGESLARGYRNHPELTESRFVDFETRPGIVERVYRTGDLVRQTADGAFEFVGRIDNQVKIRGFRIELEEIESVLGEAPEIGEAAVVVNEAEPEEKVLVAYYKAASGSTLSVESMRSFLASRLPAYMIPGHFIRVEQLPTTVNGKVDRRELSNRSIGASREQDSPQEKSRGISIQDPVVQELTAIWRRILKAPSVGLDDNFFDLGGHSIQAARLFDEIAHRLGKNLPLSTLFEAPTVATLAQIIQSADPVGWSPLVEIRSGSGTPFFCVHPIGGNVLIFKTFAEHMAPRPFYGLQARGLNKQENPHTSVTGMASDYLRYVQQVQPSGPYLIGGYSAGGLVAFEMARLLQDMGETVEILVLFDSYLHPNSLPGSVGAAHPKGLGRSIAAVTRRVAQMRYEDGGKRLTILLRDVARVWATLRLKVYGKTRHWRVSPVRLDAVAAFLFAIRNYRPELLQVPAMLFLADRNAPPSAANLPAVWQTLVTGGLEVHHLPVDHDHMLDAPHGALLARTIQERIVNHAPADHTSAASPAEAHEPHFRIP